MPYGDVLDSMSSLFMKGIHCDLEVSFLDFFESCSNNLTDDDMALLSVMWDHSWKPPLEGVFKVNSDVVLDRDKLVVGVGLVVRNCQGLIATSAQRICASYTLLVAEAVAVLHGINLAIDIGLTPFVIEKDVLVVVNSNQKASLADIGLIIGEVLIKLQSITGVSAMYVSRKANNVAHNLSKLALIVDNNQFWMEEYPLCVERFILDKVPI
ncbi:hypothetical protein Ddye_028926 [Dipteronia dyeriana]|uniref:RNase H type-1 domain-containing protein n=1 Tax=Dipteronia dyeriana TaxID=168575 RepID=A0AAD9TDH2_9ROSI|nr:hypothetical protein Ddye_028926 [Dipteronia dyeriana]